MVKLTPEIIEHAFQYTNAIKDRELDLRGYKMPAIENLGSTFDQFDTIDFSDNEIRKLDGFPLLKRLKNLVLTENKIKKISADVGENLPNLETVILTTNEIEDLRDLDNLFTCKGLVFVSLLHNPVVLKANYRLYVIGHLPNLRFLDFKRVTQSERKQAKSYLKHAFISKKNQPSELHIKTFTPGAPLNVPQEKPETQNGNEPKSMIGVKRTIEMTGATGEDVLAIQEAIKRAKTLSEVERLQHLLSSGQIAGFAQKYIKT
ncbi:U2 small nuclear ribonucleoprotein A' [Cichlidogyrus casuarinus]|uniref:U2 small nuclear ribonucleoprotein A n=1 Tax=Cichlidogyrus casuarinus TaxID=1844966 RepID=A0ABD2PP20_9PLAT